MDKKRKALPFCRTFKYSLSIYYSFSISSIVSPVYLIIFSMDSFSAFIKLAISIFPSAYPSTFPSSWAVVKAPFKSLNIFKLRSYFSISIEPSLANSTLSNACWNTSSAMILEMTVFCLF